VQAPALRTLTVELAAADGSRLPAYVARPRTRGRRPGLLLFQEAYGVNGHIRDLARRFARAGYLTIAPELFHRTAPPGFEGDYADFAAVRPHVEALTVRGLEADLRATHAWLAAERGADPGRLACVGFCMGGRVSFIAAGALPLGAAVSFYGGGIAGLLERAPGLQAPVLFFWGGRDQHIPLAQQRAVIDALRAAGKAYVNVQFSEAGHAFFCDARPSFDPAAAAAAWPLTLEFLRQHLRG
jgi:carboxymethylenebutenolidase